MQQFNAGNCPLNLHCVCRIRKKTQIGFKIFLLFFSIKRNNERKPLASLRFVYLGPNPPKSCPLVNFQIRVTEAFDRMHELPKNQRTAEIALQTVTLLFEKSEHEKYDARVNIRSRFQKTASITSEFAPKHYVHSTLKRQRNRNDNRFLYIKLTCTDYSLSDAAFRQYRNPYQRVYPLNVSTRLDTVWAGIAFGTVQDEVQA